jgi:hypothetical protein
MTPSEWAKDRIESQLVHAPVLWVEDPYAILDPKDSERLTASLKSRGRTLVLANNSFRLREQLLTHRPEGIGLVVVDQSSTPREPHQLPRDCKPSDFFPLPAPDWKPQVERNGLLCLSIRDFLISCTEDDRWPAEVNLYPYETLARRRPERFAEAYDDFIRSGRPLVSADLMLIGAGAVLDQDLLELTDPLAALELAFHSAGKWRELADYFNPDEIDAIRQRLQELPLPIGDLFGPSPDQARSALAALLVLRQHFQKPEEVGAQLAILSPGLLRFQNCQVGLITEAPGWFHDQEIPRFERLLTDEFKDHLFKHFKLDDPKQAPEFATRERFSKELRNLAPFEPVHVDQVPPDQRDDFDLAALINTFMQAKHEAATIVGSTRQAVSRLQLTPISNQSLAPFRDAFIEKRLCLLDSAIGQIQSAIQDIDGPARSRWPNVPWFAERWKTEANIGRNLATDGRRLLNELDYHFGRLLEARYAALTPSEVLSTNHFYSRFIGPRRRAENGAVQKAAILLIDSMRFDLWRQLVRPMLETEYDIEESFGFACLPSETQISRKAFFAGKSPSELPTSGSEVEFARHCVDAFHEGTTEFVPTSVRPGMAFACESKDKQTYLATFDFADNLAHAVDWQPHLIQTVMRPILREIKAILAQHGREGAVFITADHGHTLQQGGSPVYIPNSDDVGYRSAYVERRIEGDRARHLFQIPAKTLGHNRSGWFLFPKPGYYLRPEQAYRGRPGDSYRHGGLSTYEVFVPLVCLRPRRAKAKLTLSPSFQGAASVGEPSEIILAVSADCSLASQVRIVADSGEVESAVVTDIGPNPRALKLRFTPSAPGRRKLRFSAVLGTEDAKHAAECFLEITVKPGKPTEDPAVRKLKKLFGD